MMLHILSHGCDLDKNQSPAHVHLTLLHFSESQQNGEKRSVDVNFLFNVKVKTNAIFVEMLVAVCRRTVFNGRISYFYYFILLNSLQQECNLK